MTITSDIQKFNPGEIVDLFAIDTSKYDGLIHHYIPSINKVSGSIYFEDVEYTPMAMQATGFDKNSSGTIPQPKLVIADISGALYTDIKAFNDLLGSKVTRIRTFKKYIDVSSGGDGSNSHFPKDIYYIERKSNQSRFLTEFTLSALLDLQGLKLPKRLVLKNTCTHVYRVWTGSEFSYTNATCPYADIRYFTSLGVVTASPAEDACGKRYSDCELRFRPPLALPTRAFPGVSSVRI